MAAHNLQTVLVLGPRTYVTRAGNRQWSLMFVAEDGKYRETTTFLANKEGLPFHYVDNGFSWLLASLTTEGKRLLANLRDAAKSGDQAKVRDALVPICQLSQEWAERMQACTSDEEAAQVVSELTDIVGGHIVKADIFQRGEQEKNGKKYPNYGLNGCDLSKDGLPSTCFPIAPSNDNGKLDTFAGQDIAAWMEKFRANDLYSGSRAPEEVMAEAADALDGLDLPAPAKAAPAKGGKPKVATV